MNNLTISALLDVLAELFSDEVSIGITDKNNYLYFRPSKRIDLKIKAGDPIRKDTLAYKALTSGKNISEFIHRDVYGMPYHGMAVPLYNQTKLEGTLLAVYPALTQGKSVITVKSDDGWRPIPFSDVIYLEVKDRKTNVIANNFTGTHKNTLQEFEYSLPNESFIRCHRSFIANVNHISEIFPDTHSTFIIKMNNGDQIPVSQSYSSYFRKLLGF